jgi:glycosyltransferase involved in cell wall biosynthesis
MIENTESSKVISVIVPALNESSSLEELYERINLTFAKWNGKFEIIFVDDGSTDGSYEKIIAMREKHPNIALIRHRKNHGKSLALMQGFDMARGEIAITLDADLQDQPEMIPRFIEKLEEGYDMVSGWRQERKDTPSKRFVSKVFNSLILKIFDCKVHDINCGFKAYSSTVYKRLELRGDLHRLIPVIVSEMGFKVGEVPVVHAERKHGESKYRLFRHRGLLDIIAFSAKHTTQWRPFHVFCELAAFFWGGAIIALIIWVTTRGNIPEIFNILLAISGTWFLFVGTLLPLFGFYLELEADRYQNADDRKSLIIETADSKI